MSSIESERASESTQPPAAFRVAAVGDLHCTKASAGAFAPWLETVNGRAEVLLLCGDLTDYGLPEEASVLIKELSVVRVPVLAVLGNHDYESDRADELVKMMIDAGIRVLSGEGVVLGECGIVGAKGFAGGFGSGTLGRWGEPATKRFVQEAVDEALLLESGLARLRTRLRVAFMHYAPVQATVEGEPVAIHPFLGCSRLEEPLLRYPVDVVFHGHAHRGQPEGRTRSGVPVFNVAAPLLKSRRPDLPPYRVIDVTALERRSGSGQQAFSASAESQQAAAGAAY
jgi:Icc-related predicted phosphoesterase